MEITLAEKEFLESIQEYIFYVLNKKYPSFVYPSSEKILEIIIIESRKKDFNILDLEKLIKIILFKFNYLEN